MARSSVVDFKEVKAAITMEQVLNHYGLLDLFAQSWELMGWRPCLIRFWK